MRRIVLTSLAAIVAAAAAAVSAAADGGPSPGVSWGWNGVLAPGGQVRYVAVSDGRRTLVEVVRAQGGRVLRWAWIPGSFGVPFVSVNGGTGGLTRDGRTLVLASYATAPGPRVATRFAVLGTRRGLRLQSLITLRGSFSFDAVAPDASTLYLIQYTSARDYNRYRVRAYDLAAQRLVPGAIVDKREPDEAMAGSPIDRATTADGRWAYTLYARQGEAPFVHALDTVKREAHCVDLPLRLGLQRQFRLRLDFRGTNELRVRDGRKTLAVVDVAKLEARRATS
jgi:hypothetical protein